MPAVLLLHFESRFSASGKAVLITEESRSEWPVRRREDAFSKIPAGQRPLVIISGLGPDDYQLDLLLAASPQGLGYSYMEDLAYLLGLPLPEDIRELATAWQYVEKAIGELADDLLAQLVELVAEYSEEARFGIFRHEQLRRHDALSMPRAGNVEMDPWYPKKQAAASRERGNVPPDLLAQLYSARENMSRAFRQYEERPQQQEMSEAVAAALESGRSLVVEAGTGVGKSLGYLLPLALHSARTGELCLVSTNTINLQQQIVEQDVPRLQQILGELQVNISLLKGREHYLCLKRLQDTWLSNNSGARQRREHALPSGGNGLLFLLHLIIAGHRDANGDMDQRRAPDALRLTERIRIERSVDCGFRTCLGERCNYKGSCHYFSARNRAQASHIVITNHALVFALFNPADDNADNIVASASAIVFDEAHNLEGAITSQYTAEVGNILPVDLGNRLLEVLQNESLRRRLELPAESVGEGSRDLLLRIQRQALQVPGWIKAGVSVVEQVNLLLSQASQKGHLDSDENTQLTPATATPNQARVMELLEQLAKRLLPVIDRYQRLSADLNLLFANEDGDLYINDEGLQMDLQDLRVSVDECRLALEHWQPANPESIAWFNSDLSTADPRWEYKTAPLDVGESFQSLRKAKQGIILCSATLTVADSFDYLRRSLGFDEQSIEQTDWLKLNSPFDYASQALLAIATNMKRPTGDTREAYLLQLEEVILGVTDMIAGGTLVLFNSYRDLNQIAEKLSGAIDDSRLLVQGRSGSRTQIADTFRDGGSHVLLATRSFWEGFDVAGDALSCVVLAKLPFANFKDPIHAGRQRHIESQGGDSFRQYSLPLAAMQFKQGFGRLIRTGSDRGVVFLLDSRAASSNYGSVFISSLPGPRLTTGSYQACLEEARRFMEDSQHADG
ncbi:MAG: helicase C-terminal domain-containing protein [bacterium]